MDDKKKAPPIRGRFVGVVAVAKEKYQVVLLETEGSPPVVKSVKVLETGEGGGVGLAPAMMAVNMGVAKTLRDPTDLWNR